MSFLKIKPFFRGYEVTGLRRLQGYEIAKSSIYLANTDLMNKEGFHCPNKIQPLELANTHYIRYEMIEEEQFCHILIYQIQNVYKCT